MTQHVTLFVADADAMQDLGARLSRACQHANEHGHVRGVTIYLQGELGAGKTTLVRGFVQARGHSGAVKSPTYTLVEPYEMETNEINDVPIYHFDLYRLSDPEELEFMGIRDYFDSSSICLIEWPERGAGMLPAADLLFDIQYRVDGRDVTIQASTPMGEAVLSGLNSDN